MIYLILAVVASTFNHLQFKAYAVYRIDLLSAIVVNYAVCMLIGFGSSIGSGLNLSILTQDWFPFSILQGGLLAACLFLMGHTTAKHGVPTASIATRMSVTIPTIAAFFLYGDLITAAKVLGITATGYALYLSCTDKGKDSLKTMSILPVTLFLFFGAYSSLLKFVQDRFLGDTSYHTYVMAAFAWAFLISGSVLTWRWLKGQQDRRWQGFVAGLILGCTNYSAVYFLIRALSVPGGQSSQLFPTMSISIVGLSSIGALVFFKERPGLRMLGALLIGACAIVLVNWN